MGTCDELAGHAFERCMLHFDLVFDRRTRGVVAESSRSRRGVVAESSHRSLCFVGQNGGVATPLAEPLRSHGSLSSWHCVQPRGGGSFRSLLVVVRRYPNAEALVPSMHARLQEVLRCKGAMTRY